MITLFPASSLLHVLVFMPVEPLLAVHRISMIFQSLCLSLNCLLVSYKVISTTRQGSRSFISSETSFDWFRICVNRFACLNFFCLWYNGSVLKHGILLRYHHYISFKNCAEFCCPRKVMKIINLFDLWIFQNNVKVFVESVLYEERMLWQIYQLLDGMASICVLKNA